MVMVYTKPGCPGCTLTCKQLDKLKADHPDLNFCKVDITTDPEAAAIVDALGYKSAPVVVAAGDNHWSGYRPDRINALVA